MCASAVENSDAAVTVDTRVHLFFFFFLQRWRMWADLGRGPPCFIFRMFGARAGAATDSRRGFGEWGDQNVRKKKLSALFFCLASL